MPWTAEIDPTGVYVEIAYLGRVGPEDLMAAFLRAVELSRALAKPLYFADCSGLTTSPSLADLYFLADQFASVGLGANVREALLLPALADSAESVRFWETTCANRGLAVRVFAERRPALDWLLA